jgi:hypothetical protein
MKINAEHKIVPGKHAMVKEKGSFLKF